MRSLLARLAVLGAFAVGMAACSNGSGGALPFAGPPNNAGGSQGQFQSGSNGQALLRFLQGSPDLFSFFGGPPPSGSVDVCVDNLPFGVVSPTTSYGTVNPFIYSVAGGISHTVAVYPFLGPSMGGLECPTAPGPYLGVNTIAVTTISPGVNSRQTIVLGGTSTSTPNTLGLYIYSEPSFAIAPAGNAVISHNAAPAFSIGKPNGVGFGQCTTTVTPCTVPVNLTGAQAVAAPKKSGTLAPVVNGPPVQSGINAIPAGFYDGIGVPAGTVVPITSIAAPNALAGQPYVVQLYAIDGPAGGLNLVGYVEQTLGYGF